MRNKLQMKKVFVIFILVWWKKMLLGNKIKGIGGVYYSSSYTLTRPRVPLNHIFCPPRCATLLKIRIRNVTICVTEMCEDFLWMLSHMFWDLIASTTHHHALKRLKPVCMTSFMVEPLENLWYLKLEQKEIQISI